MVTHTFNTTKALKDTSGNVRVVEWEIVFTDGTYSSTAAGRTVIPKEDAVPVGSDMEEAVFNAMGGKAAVLSNLQPIHEEMLRFSALEATLVEV